MRKIVSLFAGCFLFITLTSVSSAEKTDAIALISSLSGEVEVQRAHQKDLKEARLGDQLFEADVLYTRKNAKASLLFSNGSLINVSPNSRLKLSRKGMGMKKKNSMVASLSKGMLNRVKGIFSTIKRRDKKMNSVTVVAGIRKKVEDEEKSLKVLYPRNSMILESKPTFRWKAGGEDNQFMISLTLKGMKGQLWVLQTKETEIPYPRGKKGLDRGQTYFLRVQSEEDSTLYNEVYFRVLDDKNAQEVMNFSGKMEELRGLNPDDSSPYFILANYYKGKGLYHEALKAFEALEQKKPEERFILEEKREIFSKLGLWKRWKEVNEQLKAMK